MVKQLAWLRRLPVDEAIWNETRDLMNLQKSVQLAGAETRKKAITYLLGRRCYKFWHRMGRLDQEETMGESVLPDEWAAVHYGWEQQTNNHEILETTAMKNLGHQQTMEKKQNRSDPLRLLW